MVTVGIESESRGREFSQDAEFRRFVSACLPDLLKAAYLLLRDVDLAEDAVQGTLLRVFRHWNDASAAPAAYTRTTLINVCRDYWRRYHRRPREVHADVAGVADQAMSFSESWNDRDALEQALSELAQQQREVLVLRFFVGCSVAETAELLKIPEGTVKSATHRGLDRLRDLLDPTSSEVSDVD